MPRRAKTAAKAARTRRLKAPKRRSTAAAVKRPALAGIIRERDEALEQQAATAEILKVISQSAFDLPAVLQALVSSAVRLCEADTGIVRRREGDGYPVAATSGFSEDERDYFARYSPKPDRGSVFGRAILESRSIHVPDLLADRDLNRSRRADYAKVVTIRTGLGVPLLREGRIIGVFTLQRRKRRPFTKKQIALAETFANQAVIAIENTRLLDEVQARSRDLAESLQQQTATADVLKVISRSAFDLDTIMDTLTRSARHLCGADGGALFLRDDNALVCRGVEAVRPEDEEMMKANPVSLDEDSHMGHAVLTGTIVNIGDIESRLKLRRFQRASGFKAILAVPLMREGQGIGVLTLVRFQVGEFTQRQVELVQTFANQAVIAVENVRLFNEVQAKTRDLEEALVHQTGSANILKVIASSPTDVAPFLTAIVENACSICEAENAFVALKDGDELFFQAQHGPAPVVWKRQSINRRWVTGRAAMEGRPIHVHDYLAPESDEFPDGRELARRDGARTVLAVPLMREGECIGAIVLRRMEVRPFSDRQVALLQTFADQAVIAIGNVRLFEQVRQRTAELSKSLDDLRAAQDRLVQTEKLASLGQLTAGIAHEIKNPLNFVNNFSGMSAELIGELQAVVSGLSGDPEALADIKELTGMLSANLEKIVQHGKRADGIVKSMLLHSGQSSGEHRPSDINALVDECLNRAYYGERAETRGFSIRLERSFDPDVGEVDLFPREISRAVLNLISNGFYAASKRKETEGDGYEPVLVAATRNLGDRVEIRIRDNGSGIPAAAREKMFDPFFTTKPAGEGTGLGLSITHDIIVKQHGGSIEVDTRPGEFAEIRLILPRAGERR